MSNGNTPQPPAPTEAAVSFVGPIVHPWTQCLRNVLCSFSGNMQKVTILLSSPGGSTFEGFTLYNLIRTLPYEVHMHNIGTVQSIANIVFLAGKMRTAAPHSSFLLHNITWTFAQETLTEPQVHERIIGLETAKEDFIGIFKENTSVQPDTFTSERYFENPKLMRPAEAKKFGMIHDILDLRLPSGMPAVNVVMGP